jgi:ACS family D-galactonate transporter-like MFS transporter
MNSVANPDENPQKLTGSLPIVLGLLTFSVFINYIDRGNLSIAAPMIKDELHISASQLGTLLSAFFWTYAISQIPAGWLVDRFNVNWVLALGFFLWSAATGITGLLHGFAALFVVRLILGIGESVVFPACSRILAQYFPFSHRGFANAIIVAGLACGPAFGMLAGGILMSRFGWRSFFIAFGSASMLWLPLWFRWMPRDSGGGPLRQQVGAPRTSEILLQRSAWGSFTGLFCANYKLYFLLAWLPFYLVRERHFSASSMAKIGGALYLSQALSAALTGRISDRSIASGSTQTLVRKTFLIAGILCAGVFLSASVFVGPTLCVVFLILVGFSYGFYSSNVQAVTQTLAGPRASGRWTGLQYAVANLSGVLASTLTGYTVDRTGHFFWAFCIAAGFCCASALCWAFFVGRVEPVVWRQQTSPDAGKAAVALAGGTEIPI